VSTPSSPPGLDPTSLTSYFHRREVVDLPLTFSPPLILDALRLGPADVDLGALGSATMTLTLGRPSLFLPLGTPPGFCPCSRYRAPYRLSVWVFVFGLLPPIVFVLASWWVFFFVFSFVVFFFFLLLGFLCAFYFFFLFFVVGFGFPFRY